MVLTNPGFRHREHELRQEFLQFKEKSGGALAHRLNRGTRGKALVVSLGFAGGVKMELGLIKGLEMVGLSPVVLTARDPLIAEYHHLTGSSQVLFWDEFVSPVDHQVAKAMVASIKSFEDLLALEYKGARIGRFAASTALRNLRVGSLDMASPPIRKHLMQRIRIGMVYTAAAQKIIQKVRPQMALFVDRGYTPHGELFDMCLTNGVDAVTWNAAHRSNTLMLKRYTLGNRDEHPASLSEESWRRLCTMTWTEAHRQRLQQELYNTYTNGDWYSEVGTQFNKRLVDVEELRRRLGLDSAKKTVLLFPHILWDGTFFWGNDLFGSYEEWLVETVRAACANNRVNWIIKIHPANVVKDMRDGFRGEPAEVIAIRKSIGPLPAHIFVIPAESEINTFSLYGLMDYCVTVRGTVGIEAALFGIPVITAGTGRYDHMGFTIDSENREQYLNRIARIQDIPPLSPSHRELAERFAYGVFLLRPLPLTTVTLEYPKDPKAPPHTYIKIVAREDWLNAQDIKAFAEWAANSNQPDFLTSWDT